jgi:hypothetical protein
MVGDNLDYWGGSPDQDSHCILSEGWRQTSQVNARIAEATTGQAKIGFSFGTEFRD